MSFQTLTPTCFGMKILPSRNTHQAQNHVVNWNTSMNFIILVISAQLSGPRRNEVTNSGENYVMRSLTL